jgi:hypothetical protein
MDFIVYAPLLQNSMLNTPALPHINFVNENKDAAATMCVAAASV